jgi:hypothetical protein
MRSRHGGFIDMNKYDAAVRISVIRQRFVEDKRAELPERARVPLGIAARRWRKGRRIMEMLPNRRFFPYGSP